MPWEEAQSTYVPEGCPCQDRGWIPTDNLWAYVQAVAVYWYISKDNFAEIDVEVAKVDGAIHNALFVVLRDPGQAAFDVVWEAMIAEERKL